MRCLRCEFGYAYQCDVGAVDVVCTREKCFFIPKVGFAECRGKGDCANCLGYKNPDYCDDWILHNLWKG